MKEKFNQCEILIYRPYPKAWNSFVITTIYFYLYARFISASLALFKLIAITITVFLRSILLPQNPNTTLAHGNKYHLAHVKTFLTYTACVKRLQIKPKVMFRVLRQQYPTKEYVTFTIIR
ncbi:hypothetical protein BpHYR1_054040 [Brachionus plicatilis]|uniref:Uncharacterized protein n=1 Tax=Brachionus plicatilis TaxID=10195 RepID=A0A3M7QFT5_BRAPC|nr:hypothetical protein BpHYR1_054040 [Brachionus plicatilis]